MERRRDLAIEFLSLFLLIQFRNYFMALELRHEDATTVFGNMHGVIEVTTISLVAAFYWNTV